MSLYRARGTDTPSLASDLTKRLAELDRHAVIVRQARRDELRKIDLERRALTAKLKRMSAQETVDTVNVFGDGDTYDVHDADDE